MSDDWRVTEPSPNLFELLLPTGEKIAGARSAEDVIDQITDRFTLGEVDEFTVFRMPDGSGLDLDDAIDWLDSRPDAD